MICACPCKKRFEPRRPNQKYASAECKERARRKRSGVMRLSVRERRRVERARTGHAAVVPRGNHPFPGHSPTQSRKSQHRPLGEALMTSAQVRQFLSVSKWQMREWRTSPSGGGPAFIRIGRRVRYLPSDVFSFVAARRKAVGKSRKKEGGKKTKEEA